jgi:CBS domain-containing protein
MRIADICTRNVVEVPADLSVREAARLMREQHVGTLVVTEKPNGERVPRGIVTDRDIVISVVAAEVDPGGVTVGDVMSAPPVTCREDQELFDAVQKMRGHGVRRLPVVNAQGGLSGLVAADDVFAALGTHMSELGHALTREQVREMQDRS